MYFYKTRASLPKKNRKTNGVRLAGTQQIDRTWYHVKKSIPKTLNNRKAGWLNESNITKYVCFFCVAKALPQQYVPMSWGTLP